MFPLGSSELESLFASLDTDDDGVITIRDLRSLLVNTVGFHVSLDELKEVIGKTSLDLSAFKLYYESISNNGKEEEESELLLQAFMVFDLNGDGFISCEELESVLLRLGLGKDFGDSKDVIKEFDNNLDGQIDFEEFKNMMISARTLT